MRKYLMPIYVVLFLIGATALWYFGHHRPAQQLLKAEPKKIYKSTPLPPKGLSAKPVPSEAIQAPRIDTNIETENTDPAATPEKLDNNQDRAEVTDVDELVIQEGLSVEDTAAAAEAFEKYVKAEADYQAAREKLEMALKTSIANSKAVTEALAASDQQAAQEMLNNNNSDQLLPIGKAYIEAKSRRDEALENLAVYSEDAAEMLAQIKEAEKRENEMRTETVSEYDREIRELEAEVRELDEILENLRSK